MSSNEPLFPPFDPTFIPQDVENNIPTIPLFQGNVSDTTIQGSINDTLIKGGLEEKILQGIVVTQELFPSIQENEPLPPYFEINPKIPIVSPLPPNFDINPPFPLPTPIPPILNPYPNSRIPRDPELECDLKLLTTPSPQKSNNDPRPKLKPLLPNPNVPPKKKPSPPQESPPLAGGTSGDGVIQIIIIQDSSSQHS